MVDRVELAALNRIAHVGHFDDGGTVSGEEEGYAFNEAVEVGDVREDVVGVDDFGLHTFGAHLPGKLAGKECHPSRNAALDCLLRRLAGRVDAEDGNTLARIELE